MNSARAARVFNEGTAQMGRLCSVCLVTQNIESIPSLKRQGGLLGEGVHNALGKRSDFNVRRMWRLIAFIVRPFARKDHHVWSCFKAIAHAIEVPVDLRALRHSLGRNCQVIDKELALALPPQRLVERLGIFIVGGSR